METADPTPVPCSAALFDVGAGAARPHVDSGRAGRSRRVGFTHEIILARRAVAPSRARCIVELRAWIARFLRHRAPAEAEHIALPYRLILFRTDPFRVLHFVHRSPPASCGAS